MITALLREFMLPAMPACALEYDMLIGKVNARYMREHKRQLKAADEIPAYYIGLIFVYYPIVPQPFCPSGPYWRPTKRILMVWNGINGYQEMQRKDLHHARGWKPHRIHIKPKGAAA